MFTVFTVCLFFFLNERLLHVDIQSNSAFVKKDSNHIVFYICKVNEKH